MSSSVMNTPRRDTSKKLTNTGYTSPKPMVVKTEPVTIKGHVLPTPQVVYANDSAANIRDGAWNVVKELLVAA
ncbi:hypothetical protein FIBSPDRAFT_958593 [Athelia psychrophila]|uniref:Uncharacterized protein n=1 Tax=Athelia psychrophila TaxID=1759441 RepID=A0A166EH21_9AGAM|nr:hypothetical protein FIBSPDRAFT_958784 [Fibularhizoctonia sp. CBS 109695]KZP15758.1 hypothetical protein FIBSPDRAFT_958593 [Fibularhizoctonia sp. CBS 109695]